MKQSKKKVGFFEYLVLASLLVSGIGWSGFAVAMDLPSGYGLGGGEAEVRAVEFRAQVGITSLIGFQVLLDALTFYLTTTQLPGTDRAKDDFSRAQCPLNDTACLADLNSDNLRDYLVTPAQRAHINQWSTIALEISGIAVSLAIVPLIWNKMYTSAYFVTIPMAACAVVIPIGVGSDLDRFKSLIEKAQGYIDGGHMGNLVADLEAAQVELVAELKRQPKIIISATLAGATTLATAIWIVVEKINHRSEYLRIR